MLPLSRVLKVKIALQLAAILVQAPLISAYAEVRVSGEPEFLKIEASGASIEELFAALNAAYGLQYRYPTGLNHTISGSFAGPLPQVLSRLLQGYSFVTQTSADGISIAIYDFSAPGQSGSQGISEGFLDRTLVPQTSRPHARSPRKCRNLVGSCRGDASGGRRARGGPIVRQ